jgi:outer membrane protein TolC
MPPGRMLARAAWLLGLALAGCDFAQPETLSPVPVAAHYKEEVAFRPAQQLDALPRNEWWHLYHDTQLDALEAAAGRNNPALAAQLAVYDQARAYAQQAEAGLYPTVTLQSSLSENKQSATRPLRSNTQPSNYGANTVDMAASYEIDFWGKLRNEARSISPRRGSACRRRWRTTTSSGAACATRNACCATPSRPTTRP